MKKMKIVQVFTLLFLAIGFIACDTEPVDPVLLDNIGNNPGETQGTFKVDFNGETYTATTTLAVINDGILMISGLRGSQGESVSFAVPNPEVGTFSGDDLLMYYQPVGTEYQYINFNTEETSGSVNITNIDTVNHTVSGTFSFTGWWSNDEEEMDPIEFTNGSFTNIAYTGTIPGTGGEAGDDTFTAVLNGTTFPVANVAVAVADGGLGETISINGLDANQNKIVISMQASLNPGTYNITGNILDDVVGARYTTTSPEAMYMATTGSITINSKTEDRIAGTFTFSATSGEETVTVTEGTFDVDYSF